MEYDRTLKLEFADNDDTVLYLGTACPLVVSRSRNGDKYVIRIVGGSNCAWMLWYYDESTRDRDYNYAIEYIDFLMAPIGTNVDEEDL